MTPIRTLPAFLLLFLASLLAPAASAALTQDDLLPVDEAFVLTASAPTRDRIEVRWKIADGYYLYRHRTSVKADAAFGEARLALPAGLPQHLCLRAHHIHLCERLPLHRLGQPGSEHLLMRCKAFLVLRRLHPRHARNHNRAHHHGGHAQPQLLRHAQMGHPALLVFGHQNLSSSAKARPC